MSGILGRVPSTQSVYILRESSVGRRLRANCGDLPGNRRPGKGTREEIVRDHPRIEGKRGESRRSENRRNRRPKHRRGHLDEFEGGRGRGKIRKPDYVPRICR